MNSFFQFFTILAMVILNFTPGFAVQAKTPPPPPPSPYQSCISTSVSSRSMSQTSFSFFNGCGERLYINACVTDNWGDPKLYRSGRSIQAGGRFTINTLFDMSPDKLQWVAGPGDPGIPPLCGKKA